MPLHLVKFKPIIYPMDYKCEGRWEDQIEDILILLSKRKTVLGKKFTLSENGIFLNYLKIVTGQPFDLAMFWHQLETGARAYEFDFISIPADKELSEDDELWRFRNYIKNDTSQLESWLAGMRNFPKIRRPK